MSILISNISEVDDREKLLHQRQMLNKRLGLDMAGNLKLGIDAELFSDDDLMTGIKESQQHGVVMDAVRHKFVTSTVTFQILNA